MSDILPSVLTGVLFAVVLALFYFAPSITGRKKRNARAIFILNLLLGWTLIGWVIAAVWASMKDDKN